MHLPFSFTGRMPPLPYALWAFALFFNQHVIAFLVLLTQGRPPMAITSDWQFYLMPLQMLARRNWASNLTLILALGWLLIVAWGLAALAFQRAADADITGWIAAFAVAPVVQLPVILVLSVMPSRAADRDASLPIDVGVPDIATAAQGLAAGVALTVFAVAVGALLFGSYGFGIFVVSPFIIGATTGYFANRKTDVGASRTAKLVAGAILLGGVALVMAALEGIICIFMAAPLAVGTALVGGLLGRAIAVHSRRPPQHALSSLALLPLVFAAESLVPSTIHFDTRSTIQINAPPEAVWKLLVRTDLSEEPVALPFRFGVAYPVRGEVLGEGIGAIRLGEFSTGTVLERVTQWIPNRKLAFIMLDEVPAMRELSPYAHVHAPHVVGYFSTTDTSFELTPRAGGGTEIVERTSHELRLEPALYWLPFARWVVHENNARVLAHIQRQAERSRTSSD